MTIAKFSRSYAGPCQLVLYDSNEYVHATVSHDLVAFRWRVRVITASSRVLTG